MGILSGLFKKQGENPAEVIHQPSRKVELADYVFELPEGFAEPEIQKTDRFALLKTAATRDLTFDVFVVRGGGDKAIDGYFASALRHFDDVTPRGFDLEHMGQHFRGWLYERSKKLSSTEGSFIQYYGTIAYGDAICFSMASFARQEDANFEMLLLSIIHSAIVRRGYAAAGME